MLGNSYDEDGSNLAICKKIVDIGGGEIDVYSSGPDQGSMFQFSMTMEPEQEQAAIQRVSPIQEPLSPGLVDSMTTPAKNVRSNRYMIEEDKSLNGSVNSDLSFDCNELL